MTRCARRGLLPWLLHTPSSAEGPDPPKGRITDLDGLRTTADGSPRGPRRLQGVLGAGRDATVRPANGERRAHGPPLIRLPSQFGDYQVEGPGQAAAAGPEQRMNTPLPPLVMLKNFALLAVDCLETV